MANEQIKFLYSSASNLPGTITNGSLYFHKDRSDQKGGSLYGDFGGSRYKFSGEMRDFGAMPITAAANDTVATWAALGTGFARYSDTEKHLDGQPSLKGILVQYCSASDAASIAQNWYDLDNGTVYYRTSASWKWLKQLDATDWAANDAMVFKGVINKATDIPAQNAGYSAGWTYKVATAGTYVGQTCEVGDMVICINNPPAASPSESVVNSDWAVIQTNVVNPVSTGSGKGPVGAAYTPVYVDNTNTVKACSFTIPSNAKFTDTDTKVTSVGNHYTPAADSNATLSADASGTNAAAWGSTSLVTGVNLQRDAKGHVTGITLDSIKMPTNPNTNTHYTTKLVVASTNTGNSDSSTTTNESTYLNLFDDSTLRNSHLIKGGNSISVTAANGAITIQDTVMTGAAADVAGKAGIVPAPAKGDQLKFLRADGTWVVPTDTNTHWTSHLKVGASSTATANATASNGNVWINLMDENTVRDAHNIIGTGATTVTSDANGKITINSSNTHYNSNLIVANSATATANAAATNGSVCMNLVENNAIRNAHKIIGSGATTVTSDANGNITISSTDTNTTYSAGTGISISSNKITNTGVRSVSASTANRSFSVNTNGTTSTIQVPILWETW